MSGFLLVNPRAGAGRPSTDELLEAARRRGIEAHVLRKGDDPFELARQADASALGMAGGDGSLAPVAAAALERDLPFVCVPFGTYNHFAWDAGLDRDDPLGALAAFGGRERRVDVGRAGDETPFLNTVSFGLYAALVAEEDRVGTRLGAAARLVFRPKQVRLVIDAEPVTARIVVVGNNVYRLHPLEVGQRPRLDEGILHLGIARGLLPWSWEERRARRLSIDAPGPSVEAAVDGEPVRLRIPVELKVEPRALRLLLPERR
ncbi:MAG TPA: diacylglycerol kinase family protein [Gaiellaceae bacterium]|nr:diacylglycerol kinase family protein [Gaiellaceae bacterium]